MGATVGSTRGESPQQVAQAELPAELEGNELHKFAGRLQAQLRRTGQLKDLERQLLDREPGNSVGELRKFVWHLQDQLHHVRQLQEGERRVLNLEKETLAMASAHEAQLAEATEEIEQLQKTAKAIESCNKWQAQDLDDLKSQLQAREWENAGLRAELSSLHQAPPAPENDAAAEEISKLRGELQAVKSCNAWQAQDLSDLRAQLQAREWESAGLRAELISLHQAAPAPAPPENDAAAEELCKLRSQLQAQQEKMEALEQQLQAANRKISAMELANLSAAEALAAAPATDGEAALELPTPALPPVQLPVASAGCHCATSEGATRQLSSESQLCGTPPTALPSEEASLCPSDEELHDELAASSSTGGVPLPRTAPHCLLLRPCSPATLKVLRAASVQAWAWNQLVAQQKEAPQAPMDLPCPWLRKVIMLRFLRALAATLADQRGVEAAPHAASVPSAAAALLVAAPSGPSS